MKVQPSHIQLFHLHDNIPKAQFLLAYHYSFEENVSIEKAKKYIDLAITNGIGLAHNIRGCLADSALDQAIECFNEAMQCGSTRAYSNLGIQYFHHKKNEELSSKYFEMGIKENIPCCKFLYLELFEKDKESYFEQVSKCAKDGCREALNLIYHYENDEKKKKDWAKVGAKKGFDTYIRILIDYYETHNQFKFWRLLTEYKSSTDVNVLLYVAKKYSDWYMISESLSAIYNGLELEDYECYNFAANHLDGIFDNPKHFEILANFLEKHKKNLVDELNLSLAYGYSGKSDKMKEMLDKIEDPYHQNLGYFKYYDMMNDAEKSFQHLEKAYELDKESFNSYADLGTACLNRGQRDKGLRILEAGISLSLSSCYVALGDHYLQEGHYYEACQNLIEPLKNHRKFANDRLERIIDHNPTAEIGKLLIENELSQGIMCLMKSDIKNEQLLEMLNDAYLFEETCQICLETKKELKFSCGHYSCIDCLKKMNFKCAFCKQRIGSFLKMN